MPYTIQLDVAYTTPKSMVKEFAQSHGCDYKLITENGPAGGNPIYEFSSNNFDYLWELTDQLLGPNKFSEDEIREMMAIIP